MELYLKIVACKYFSFISWDMQAEKLQKAKSNIVYLRLVTILETQKKMLIWYKDIFLFGTNKSKTMHRDSLFTPVSVLIKVYITFKIIFHRTWRTWQMFSYNWDICPKRHSLSIITIPPARLLSHRAAHSVINNDGSKDFS